MEMLALLRADDGQVGEQDHPCCLRFHRAQRELLHRRDNRRACVGDETPREAAEENNFPKIAQTPIFPYFFINEIR